MTTDAPVSESDIVREIGAILSSADMFKTTVASVHEQLEKNLGTDLSEKKDFIREQVDKYLAENGKAEKSEAEEPVENATEKQEQPATEEGPNDQELEQFRENIEQAIEDSQVEEAKGEPDKPQSPESAPKEKKKRGGLNKLCRLSPELQTIIGEEALPRTQVVKQLWVYIRANNLQDPENKRNIICDDALKELFGTDSTDMFQMNKLLSKHIFTMSEEDVAGYEESEPKAKKQKTNASKGKGSGLTSPSPISDALQKFFGTGESEVARSEVVKRLWDYIRANQLQDPNDKRKILCDNKLQELFECDSFVGFSMTKLLASHFVKS